MALFLDAGPLIAVDRRDRQVRATLAVAQRAAVPVRTGATVVARVWRDGRRPANLARVLVGVDVLPLDADQARKVGELLGATGTTDVVDGHLDCLAESADRVLTSDPEDMARLLEARGGRAVFVRL